LSIYSKQQKYRRASGVLSATVVEPPTTKMLDELIRATKKHLPQF